MTAPVILIEAQPRRVADGVAETVRLAGGGALLPYTYGGYNDWRAGAVGLPTLIASLDYTGGDFPAGSVPAAAEIEWAPAKLADLAAMAAYMWFDADITVRIGDEGAALPGIVISGQVLDVVAGRDGKLRISLADPAAKLKKPLLTSRYAGTGGIEGPIEWTGLIKRRLWGRVWNVRGEPIDRANNIYCYADPTKQLQAIDAVRDKGANAAALTTLAWQGSVAATFTALQAAAGPAGGGVRCPSIACVKWWTQPAGDLCADIKGEVGAGYVEKTASIAQRLVEAIGGPAFVAGTVAAANAARTAPVGWVADSDTETCASMLDELLGGSSLMWLLDAGQQLVIRAWEWGASVATATSHSVARQKVLRPVAKRRVGYQRNELRMARGDLAAIVLADTITFTDGTPLQTVQPAEPGATSGTGITLYDRHGGTYLITGNTVTKAPGAASAWDYSVYSRECCVGGAMVSGQLTDNTFMGLSTDVSDNSYGTGAKASWHRSGAGYWQAYVGGSVAWTGSSYGGLNFGPDTAFSISYDGFKYRYFADNVLVYTYTGALTGGQTHVAHCSGYYPGAVIKALRLSASSDLRTYRDDGTTIVPQAEFRTSEGVAAAIAGQAATATNSDFSAVTGATKPENNADVTAASQVITSISPTNQTIAADYTGAITGVLSDVVWIPIVTKGGVTKRTDNLTTYALSGASGGTFAVDNTAGSSTKGNVTITAMSALSASVILTITYNGVQVGRITVQLDKVLGSAPSSGGTPGKTVSWISGDFVGLNTVTYTLVATPLKTVALASGESLYGTAPLDIAVSGNGTQTRQMSFKFQYSVAGANSWTDFAAAITSSTATSGDVITEVDPVPGSVAVTQTKSGLAAGNWDVRLVAACSATGRTCTASGTATIQAKV